MGFGGPIATVGYMQRDLVEHRRWIDRRDFLDGVALGQTMPGPLAAQVAMWVGYLRKGATGALAVALAFIAPRLCSWWRSGPKEPAGQQQRSPHRKCQTLSRRYPPGAILTVHRGSRRMRSLPISDGRAAQ